ncbi:hypothetical protein FHJ31_24525 [Pseudomonas sp. Fig-3]|uniref:hypothetical protein n=1 Tax=unclassified Pseudomonas TaxID=196821 RepID=UPI001111C4B5|nr:MULTISPECIES: hypothetical protein [unclassified Pseudomonas]TNB78790.1 hypothetical protein FHJ31_24525 [Pseudomonas sp. Fig-3]
MTQHCIPLALSDDEFTTMTKEFDSSGEWMCEQLASKRVASSPDALRNSGADTVLRVPNRKPVDDYDDHVQANDLCADGMKRFWPAGVWGRSATSI